jgi:hypothetical protein
MLFAFLLLACLIMACVVKMRSDLRRAARDAGGGAAGATGPSAPDRSPQTLEGVLSGQLVAGQITRSQYRQAMASLAARDAERHPLEVPPDPAPPEAA